MEIIYTKIKTHEDDVNDVQIIIKKYIHYVSIKLYESKDKIYYNNFQSYDIDELFDLLVKSIKTNIINYNNDENYYYSDYAIVCENSYTNMILKPYPYDLDNLCKKIDELEMELIETKNDYFEIIENDSVIYHTLR